MILDKRQISLKLSAVQVFAILLICGVGNSLAQAINVYSPQRGQPERKALMDAIRLSMCPTTIWQVHYLQVAKKGNAAIAIAEVSDSERKTDCEGIFFLQGLGTQWKAVAAVSGSGGAVTCDHAEAVHEEIVKLIDEFGAPRNVLPQNFWDSYSEATEGSKSESEDCRPVETWGD